MIDERTIQRVKDSANVVDVLRDFYDLRRDGVNYTCLCPFHEDRHIGSFKISAKYNRYVCYSCGASGNSVDFLMEHEGMSFPDAIRWLGRKNGIDVEGSEKFTVKPSQPHMPPPPLPMLKLDYGMVKRRMDTSNDNLCNYIRQLPWDSDQKERVEKAFNLYLVGHAVELSDNKYKPDIRTRHDFTLFWLVDEQGFVRTGKMMKYYPPGHDHFGHRDKESPFGKDWVTAALARPRIKRDENGKAFRDEKGELIWETRFTHIYDPEKQEVKQTLFGMHLLDIAQTATVSIVESEKTALICAIAYGGMKENVWMASGGMTNLSPEKLKPIIQRERRIILYPDHDGIEAWKQRAKEIGYKKLTVAEQFVTDNWTEADGPKADIADIFIRIMDDQQRHAGKAQLVGDVVKEMIRENPNMQLLIDKFDLYETGR